MKRIKIKTESLQKIVTKGEERLEKRNLYLDTKGEAWIESDKYDQFEDETDELSEIVELTRELIDRINEWNNTE